MNREQRRIKKRDKAFEEEITDILTPQGLELPVGHILKFTKTDLRITRKKNGRVWATHTKAFTRDEVAKMEQEAMEAEAQAAVAKK